MTRCGIGLSIVLMVCLPGCSDSTPELAKARTELEMSKADVQSLQTQLANSKAEAKRLQSELENAKAEAKSFQSALEKTYKNSELKHILAVADNFLEDCSARGYWQAISRGTKALQSSTLFYVFRKWSIDSKVTELSAHEVSLHGTLQATEKGELGSGIMLPPFKERTVSFTMRLVKTKDPAEWRVDGFVYKE